VRHIEVLTEEPSMARTLETLFSTHLPATLSYGIIQFNGVEQFFDRLPERLAGYRAWVTEEYRIVLLCDGDDEDCRARKGRIEKIALDAGFATKAAPAPDGGFAVVSRLAIEELEAWFFGDVPALCAAYPGVPASLGEQRRYRDPDAIRDTAEALLRVLQGAGHYKGLTRLPKLEVAGAVSEKMEPATNRSRSFRVFWDTVIGL
jgi:hypothetical protein